MLQRNEKYFIFHFFVLGRWRIVPPKSGQIDEGEGKQMKEETALLDVAGRPDVLLDPVEHLGDPGVDPGVSWEGAPAAPGDHAHHGVTAAGGVPHHQWACGNEREEEEIVSIVRQ